LLARENTIKELGRLKDARAVPILTRLLTHASPPVRLSTIEALRGMQWSDETRSNLERLAAHDPDRDVQRAAIQALVTPGPYAPQP
jgi:HEAT repeat protein